ncbi:MAG: NUDIX hydrolase [Bacteroidetes bacterium]|nr:MAG: NUDIX hydrolase [Bacteroidota bacterium]
MYIKIYFGNKPVFLCDEVDSMIHEYLHHPDAIFIDEITGPAIKSLLHEIKKPDFHAGILWNEDLEKLKKSFWKHFTVLQAGGGLVKNEKEEILMIFRRGFWDLPKGKRDKGETIEDCALREVKEETGIRKLKLQSHLITTYHTYDEYGKHLLKESYWYNMASDSNQKLEPQLEEDIREIQWVAPENLKKKLDNTFPSIIDVVHASGVLA